MAPFLRPDREEARILIAAATLQRDFCYNINRGSIFYMQVKALVLMMILGATLSGGAFAASQLVSSSITFGGAPATIVVNNTLDFGAVEAGTAGTYTVSTTGSLSSSGPGIPEGGTPTAAHITVSGSLTQTVDITESNAVDDNGVHLANFKCDYDGSGSGACNFSDVTAPGTGKVLLVGADAVVDGSQSDGLTAHPTFDITVTYH
jgi:hypothetical protein